MLRVMNSLFMSNSTDGTGAAIYAWGPSEQTELVVSNCTFLGNTAVQGSTIAQESISQNSGNQVRIHNSIVWDGPAPFWNNGHPANELSVEYSNVQGGWAGMGNIDLDPQFVDPEGLDGVLATPDDDVRLVQDSPCIDAGNAALLPADTADVDGDQNITEPLPLDADGHLRAFGTVDMGAYELTPNCNKNALPDYCDLSCGPPGEYCDVVGCGSSTDCNGNEIPDECDPDCEGNGVPDACECLGVTAGFPVIETKNRYISFEPGNACLRTAVRVTLAELPQPWTHLVGQGRWVGPPRWVSEISNLADATAPVIAVAELQCLPHFEDWSEWGTLHVYAAGVVPNARYEAQIIHEGCPLSELNFSTALSIETEAVWADVAAPFGGTGQPNFVDISALVEKFRDVSGAIGKTLGDLEPNVPNQRVNFGDISAAVNAFRGLGYLFSGPSACP
jgi:hypothetical protein